MGAMTKRIWTAGLLLLVCMPLLRFAFGFEQTWTGEIIDSACKLEHQEVAEGQPVLPAPECVKACLRGGSKYGFTFDEKFYDIENQKHPELEKFAGQKVKLTGEMKGTTITVSKIEPAGP